MADTRTEIERLRSSLRQAERDMEDANAEYRQRLDRETRRIRRESEEMARSMRRDVEGRFSDLQDSLSEAYLREVRDMRGKYEEMSREVEALERRMDIEIERLTQEQETVRQRQANRDERERTAAVAARDRWNALLREIGKYPVDIFFPQKIHIYLRAGQSAEDLMKRHLYGLSAAQFESAALGLQRLRNDTRRQMDEITAMLTLYNAKLDEIDRALCLDGFKRMTDEEGNVVLELDDEDIDYWSDCLYGELLRELASHRAIARDSAETWIEQKAGQQLSPAYLLDRQIQTLDSVPERLRMCVSYAMSACDSYNQLIPCREKLISIMDGQNYRYVDTTFGACRLERVASEGFERYPGYLSAERCFEQGTPDYREARVVRFRKGYPDGSFDVCRVCFVPVRKDSIVSCGILLALESERLPSMVERELVRLMAQEGIPAQITQPGQRVTTAGRALDREELTRLAGVRDQSRLQSKYSV